MKSIKLTSISLCVLVLSACGSESAETCDTTPPTETTPAPTHAPDSSILGQLCAAYQGLTRQTDPSAVLAMGTRSKGMYLTCTENAAYPEMRELTYEMYFDSVAVVQLSTCERSDYASLTTVTRELVDAKNACDDDLPSFPVGSAAFIQGNMYDEATIWNAILLPFK
ncbi:hypothetical protein HY772_06355 [Candidatus Woesearchaeota archaeon]|nr:hypothetical protein [Candidatus Woesearchaeota archaeon]